MRTAVLGEICRPKQWRTLSKAQMAERGFRVYGANGRIGFTDSFTHEEPTILIGCRGSCGSVHVSEPRSYVNGNAMALGELDASRAELRYLYHFFRWRGFDDVTTGSAQPQIIRERLVTVLIPLPAIEEQRRIAAILDQADALRSIRRQSLRAMDLAVQAIFDEMFGDPAVSSHGYPMRGLGSLASVFSDGPFGSNLKSSHYVESGVRVVRLQNIGAGEFRDGDAAYISEDHFTELRRHECRPGDVLIATLGDPNLRACLQPEWLSLALNKADCVQMRVDTAVADSSYVVALLNHPGTLSAAGSLVLGQTRGRISMGRLRGLKVPLPPLGEQREFAARQRGVGRLRRAALDAQRGDAELHGALLDRAFKGEL